MKIRFAALAVALTFIVLAGLATAADNPTGTWKWTTTFNNQTRESTLKLKLDDGNKLTGVYIGGQGNTETPIEDATVKDNTISFKVTRAPNDQKPTTKHTGTSRADTT